MDTLNRETVAADLGKINRVLNTHLGKYNRAEVEQIINEVEVSDDAKILALDAVKDVYSGGPLFSNLFTYAVTAALDLVARRTLRGDFG